MSEASKNLAPKPEEVEGFPLSNRHAKIVKDHDFIRVVERHYYWDKEKGRGLEKRTYIGYVVDGVYYSNDKYRRKFKRSGKKRVVPRPAPQEQAPKTFVPALETKVAAEFPLYYAVAEDCGLVEDLTVVWGEHAAQIILSVAFQWLNLGQNAAYRFEGWSCGKYLPYSESISSKELSEFFDSLVRVPAWRKNFFRARIERLPEDEMLSFDATAIASESENMSYVHFGKGKGGFFQNQLGLILLLGHRTKMSVLFRVLPGNITDVTTVPDMLFRFDEITEKKRVFAAVVDRGYCSMDNIARFIDAGSRVIVAAKTNRKWVSEAIEDALSDLWMPATRVPNDKCRGQTVPMEKEFPDGKKRRFWVQVYRTDERSQRENDAFFSDLDRFEREWLAYEPAEHADETEPVLKQSPLLKYYINPGMPGVNKLIRNDAAIAEATRYFGCFCNITTFECTAAEALLEYQTRDSIEKCFKGGKSYADMDTLRAHSDETAEGRLLVGFCCMTILTQIYKRMRQITVVGTGTGRSKELPPLITQMSFNTMKDYLSSSTIVFDGRGNKRWCEIPQKQHTIAESLGFPDLYKNVPAWGPK